MMQNKSPNQQITKFLVMDNLKNYTEANRSAWNEAMPLHQKANKDKWDIAFSVPDFSIISEKSKCGISPPPNTCLYET